jgi:capsid protein
MPFNIAAGNSAGYNYASGRLDHQTYYKSIRVDQAFIATRILDRILNTWLREYGLTHNLHLDSTSHQWFWDGIEHVDPNKEAAAQEKKLKNGTTTLAYEYARQGRDWEEELHQLAREKKLKQKLGLTDSQPNTKGNTNG